MKRIVLAALALSFAMSGFAQEDSTQKEKVDTIKIGGMVIIKKGDKSDTTKRSISISNRKKHRSGNLTTNWWVMDFGFANLNDQTNYSAPATQAFAPGSTDDWFNLRTGKSVNVNIWVFMQKMNIVKHVLNLKYGLGVELNNYRFEDKRIQLTENPTTVVLNDTWKDLKKNKLAADYVTVPLLLNLNFTPGKERGFGLSGGVSAGYLYSARQKIKDDDNKDKFHDNFDLRKWKLSYIGELNLGPVKLYGSYAMKSMWEDDVLDQTPYNVGIRLSRF